MPSLETLSAFLDRTLDIARIPDYPGAVNGVQLANERDITHVATAVDFSTESAKAAASAGAQLLIVHHGMFWGGVQPIVGHRRTRLAALLAGDIAVYSAHLPLD